MNFRHKKKFGFTMVELIVAISVFSVAISLVTGAFVRTLKTQRILNHLMAVNSNASLVIEQMMREIRTGYNFSVVPNCDELIFTRSRDNRLVSYKWNAQNFSIEIDNGAGFKPLTASNVAVRSLCFTLVGGVADPPRITMTLKVGSTEQQIAENVLNLQTTVSGRILQMDLAP